MAVETPPDQLTELPPLIPRDVLFGDAEKSLARLSPDGRRISYVAPVDGILNIHVTEADGDAAPRQVTKEAVRSIRQYHWAADSRHILYVQDTGGDENWHVFTVDLETGEIADRTPFPGVAAQIQDIDSRHPDDVLLAMNKDNPQLHDLYRLRLSTGELELIEKNPGFLGFAADHDHVVRVAITMNPDGSIDLLTRSEPGADWRVLVHVPFEDSGSFNGELGGGFNADGSKLVIPLSVGANAARLVRIDLATGDQEVLFEDSEYDVTVARLNPVTNEPDLVAVLRERLHWHSLDGELNADLAKLRELAPGDLTINSRSEDDTRWLVAFANDTGPVAYYLYDRKSGDTRLLFKDRPALEKYTLAAREPFSFQARDGLTIHGYLTFPPGLERRNLRTVFWVHGGPWARDVWGFDPFSQLFANRGYLCVQVNYRGSTGYGKQFVNAGDREWGGKMHTDLVDAVEHLVAEGYVDRSKVAISGGSYGGYATLVGVTFTPDVFCCGVDIVGPSNLITFINSVPEYWKPFIAMLNQRVGNVETEEDFLWSRSPLSKVDQIRVPLLIVQGENDPRVKKPESDQIVAAMEQRGIPHEYVVVKDEGHGFANSDNWIRFAGLFETFLAEHLDGRTEG